MSANIADEVNYKSIVKCIQLNLKYLNIDEMANKEMIRALKIIRPFLKLSSTSHHNVKFL